MRDPGGRLLNAADAVLEPALAAGYRDAAAILWRDQSFSYGEIDLLTNKAANMLLDLGLQPDMRVAIMLHDTPEFVVCYLGAMRAGGVAVAINTRNRGADLAHIVSDSGAEILLIDEDFAPNWTEIAGEVGNPVRVVATNRDCAGKIADLMDTASSYLEPQARNSGDMAFWIYTSGTTGPAKAAMHAHKDVLNSDRYISEILGVRRGDVLFATSRLFFAYALGTCLFGAFRLGATTLLCDGRMDPGAAASAIEEHRPSIVFSVPTFYRDMLESGVAGRPGFNQVRHFVSAGERLPETLWTRWRETTGAEILDGMGTSETVYMLLTNVPGRVKPGASGRAAPGVEIRLAPAAGPEVEEGMPQALWAKIPSCATAYWNQPESSAIAFDGDWFCTNDIYEVDKQGHWHHKGRLGDMLKVSGQWVSPSAVEDIVRSDTPVVDCAAVGVHDADGLPRIHLFAVARKSEDAGDVLAERIRNAVRARLAPHTAPKWVTFVDEIPRTVTGKVQRYRLAADAGEQTDS